MKLIHLSDFHLGKRVNGFSMIEDQKHILREILSIIEREAADCVVIAGDIYDKSIPSAEAVELFDDFLVRLANSDGKKLQVFVISGNHDSPERLAFGNRLMDGSGIHLSPVYKGTVTPFSLYDEYGKVDIYMLPFVKPAHVRSFYPDDEINSYTDALRVAISKMNIDTSNRNILITHQFVTGAERSDSEDISIGGSDNVSATVFDKFDYVALGHIHGPQNVGSKKIRYCGTPLKYSFSEAEQKKSVTVVELGAKGNLVLRTVPLTPKRDMAEIKGTYAGLMCKKFYEGTSYQNDYMHITLTDEEDMPDVIGKLRTVYNNLMKLDYENERTRYSAEVDGANGVEKKSPFELFSEFYELQNNVPMSGEQEQFVKNIIEEVWREKE